MYLNLIKEEIEVFTLKNGLTVHFYKDINATLSYANYITLFGSNNLNVSETKLPPGIAHYLEHIMFATKKGDIFKEYANYGAYVNAYTSFTHTSYHFETVDNFEKSLKLLIKQVQKPEFTSKDVEKEQNIIQEEIGMYESQSITKLKRARFNTVSHDTNYKYDILGTRDTIKEITYDHVKLVHDNFYVPSNQILVIYGNLELDYLSKILEEYQLVDAFDNIKKNITKEDIDKTIEEIEVEDDSSMVNHGMTTFNFQVPVSSDMRVFDSIIIEVYLKSLFSKMNKNYNDYLDTDKFNNTVNYSFYVEDDISFVTVSYQTDGDVRKIHDNVIKFMASNDENLIDLAIKSIISSEIINSENRLDLIQYYAYQIGSMYDVEEFYTKLETLTTDDVFNRFNELLKTASKSFVYIQNKTGLKGE